MTILNMNDNLENDEDIDENGEIYLCKACTLEYAKENGNDTVTEEAADVGVNGHLKSNSF